MNVGELATLGLVVDSSQVERGNKSLNEFQRTAGSAEKATASLTSAAKLATNAIAAIGVGMSLNKAISTISAFQDEMSALKAISSATAQEMQKLEKQARQLGASTQYGANQAAEAQKYLAQAGLSVNQTLGATPQVLQLAQAGMLGLGEAADLATDIMAQMGLTVNELGHLNDVLVKTANSATTTVAQLGQAFSYAGPVAASFGLSLEDTSAALGIISNNGIKASRAGTGLLGVLRQLGNVTPDNEKLLNAYGLTIADVDVSTRGLSAVMKSLKDANLGAADAFKLFGSEAASAGIALTKNTEAYDDSVKTLKEVQDEAQRVSLIMTDNLGGSIKSLNSAIDEMVLQMGDAGMAGGLRTIVDLATGVIQVMNGMGDEFAEANNKSELFGQTINLIGGYFKNLGDQWDEAVYDITIGIARLQDQNAQLKSSYYGVQAALLQFAASGVEGFANLSSGIRGFVESAINRLITGINQAELALANLFDGMAMIPGLGDTFNGLAASIRNDLVPTLDLSNESLDNTAQKMRETANGALNLANELSSTNYVQLAEGPRILKEGMEALGDSFIWNTDNLNQQLDQHMIVVKKATETASKGAASNTKANKELESSLKSAMSTYETLWAQFDPAGKALKDYNDKTKQLDLLLKNSKISTDAHRMATAELRKEYESSIDAIDDLFGKLSPAQKALNDFDKTVKSLKDSAKATGKSQLELNAAIGLAAMETSKTTLQYDKNYQRMVKLESSYGGTSEKAKTLASDVAFLQKQIARGNGDIDNMAMLLKNAEEEQRKLSISSDETAKAFQKSWEDASERVDKTFADAFAGAFDSFSSFSSSLLDGFKRLLAELAYQATLKPIVVGFTSSVGGMLGIPGVGGSAGGSGGLSFSNLGQLSNVTKLFGGNSIGTGLESAGNFIARQTGIGSTVGTGLYNSAGGYTSGFGSQVATGGNGGIFSGASGTSNLALGAYGIGGGLVGSWANGALGGDATGGTIGSAAGAAIGTAIAPGIGTAIGSALGSVAGGAIGNLFGSSREPFVKTWTGQQNADPRNFYRDYYANTDLGTVGILDKQKMDPEPLVEWVNAIEQVDNSIAAMLDQSQLEKVRKELADPSKSKGTDLAKVTEERYDRVIQTLVDSSSDLTSNLVSRIGKIQADSLGDQANDLAQALQIGRIVDNASGVVKKYAESVAKDTSKTLEGILSEINSSISNYEFVKTSFKELGLAFNSVSDAAIEVSNSIVKASGGLESLKANTQSYYESFYTEEEKFNNSASVLKDTFNGLNLSVPKTYKEMRSLIKSLDLTTESGQKSFSVLTSNSKAIKQYIDTIGNWQNSISEQYQKSLNRMPEKGAVDYWVDSIRSGSFTLEESLSRISNSVEAVYGDIKKSVQMASSGSLNAITKAMNSYNSTISVYENRADLQKEALANTKKAIDSLTSVIDSLNRSDLSGEIKKSYVSNQYQSLLSKAQNGDTEASEKLAEISRDYLNVSKDSASTATEYARIYGNVNSDLNGLVQKYENSNKSLDSVDKINKMQLDEQQKSRETLINQLNTQIGMLDGINTWSDLLASLPENISASIQGIVAKDGGRFGNQVLPDGIYTSTNGFDSADKALNKIFNESLGRNIDKKGLDYYKSELASGKSLEAIKADVAWSAAHGSHAKGLDDVPFDGYRAELHKGEMVLTKEVAETVRAGVGSVSAHRGGSRTFNAPTRINSAPQSSKMGSPSEYDDLVEMKAQIKQGLYQIAKNTQRFAKIIDRWDMDGLPKERDVDIPE